MYRFGNVQGIYAEIRGFLGKYYQITGCPKHVPGDTKMLKETLRNTRKYGDIYEEIG